MPTKTVERRIDDLLASAAPEQSADLTWLMAILQQNQAFASKGTVRYFGMLVLAWAAFYAIGSGVVSEGEVSSLKFNQVKVLLIAGPPVLGLLFYVVAAAWNTADLLLKALARCVKHRLPVAHDGNLQYILASPTLWMVEIYVDGESSNPFLNRLQTWWRGGLVIILIGASFIAIAHVSVLLYRSAIFTTTSVIVSVSVGYILWCRGMLLAIVESEMTE